MLKDVKLKKIGNFFWTVVMQLHPSKRISEGVYLGDFNFDLELGIPNDFCAKYPILTDMGCYGVCDNFNQVLERGKKDLYSCDRYFVIIFTEIKREDQDSDGGWRWHKWGEYIGNQKPMHEYLYDDKHIDKVYCYHIIEITNYPELWK